MRDMRTPDEAARRTAINLMRLLEAIEMEDAKEYTDERYFWQHNSPRFDRLRAVARYYRDWFNGRG